MTRKPYKRIPGKVSRINITDKYVLDRVKQVQAQRGDRTATATASTLLIEKITELDHASGTPEHALLNDDEKTTGDEPTSVRGATRREDKDRAKNNQDD